MRRLVRLREIAFADIKTGDRIRVEATIVEEGFYSNLNIGDSWAIEGEVAKGVNYFGDTAVEFIGPGGEYLEAVEGGTVEKYFLLGRTKPKEPTDTGAIVRDSMGTYIRAMPGDDGEIHFVSIHNVSQQGIVLWDEIGDDVTILFTGVDLD